MSNTKKVFNPKRAGSHIVGTSNCGSDNVPRSRLRAKIATGFGILLAGTVMGKITATDVYRPVNIANTNGSEWAVGVLFDTVDTGADTGGTINAPLDTGDIVVHGGFLTVYGTGMSAPDLLQVLDDLTASGVVIRNLADVTVTEPTPAHPRTT